MTNQHKSSQATPAPEPLLDSLRVYLVPVCLIVGVLTSIHWSWHQQLDVHIKRTPETMAIAGRISSMNVHIDDDDSNSLQTLMRYPLGLEDWRFDRPHAPWSSGGTLYLTPDQYTPIFTVDECRAIARHAVVNHGELYPDAPLRFRALDTLRGGCLFTLP